MMLMVMMKIANCSYSADDEDEVTDELIAPCTLLMTLCDAGHEMDDHFSWR